MKNKLFITIIIGAIILSVAAGIMAFNQETTIMERMKRFSKIEVVEDIEEYSIRSRNIINSVNTDIQDNVKEYMLENQLIKNNESDYKIQLITNNITNEKYYRMTGTGVCIDIIKETGEVRRYINANPTDFIIGTTYDKEKVEEVAKKIMTTNKLLKVSTNYELTEIKENLNYYPTACFKDDINNKLMYMIFDPESEEIMAIATKAIPVSENNEIRIDEDSAKNIAEDIANMTQEDILKIELKEVVPNSMFLEPGYYYSDMNIKRNAYVITFDTASKLQVFVDATTGEILGGDGVW